MLAKVETVLFMCAYLRIKINKNHVSMDAPWLYPPSLVVSSLTRRNFLYPFKSLHKIYYGKISLGLLLIFSFSFSIFFVCFFCFVVVFFAKRNGKIYGLLQFLLKLYNNPVISNLMYHSVYEHIPYTLIFSKSIYGSYSVSALDNCFSSGNIEVFSHAYNIYFLQILVSF